MSIVRILSWNVNGLRAVFKKDFKASIAHLDADILAIQETKLQAHQLTPEMTSIPGYDAYFAHATSQKGYSGVGVYTRIPPLAVNTGIGIDAFDAEGRIIELIFNDFVFFNIYFPNGQMSPKRLAYKLDFYQAVFDYIQDRHGGRRSIVIAGDYNTAHNEIDLKNPKQNQNYSGFLRIERDWLDKIIALGYVDTFRHLHPDTVQYSWWTYRFNARAKNVGWRIDYIFTSQDMAQRGQIQAAFIDDTVYGSDHCPVGLIISSQDEAE